MADLQYLLDVISRDPEYENLSRGSIVLIETNEDLLKELSPLLLRPFSELSKVIILLTDKSYFDVIKGYDSAGVHTDNLFMIDCVSKSRNLKVPDDGHVIDLDGVGQLSKVFTALLNQTEAFDRDSLVFVDSFNALITDFDTEHVAGFLHILLTKLRNKRIGCLLLSVQDALVEDVRAEIVQLFDKVIHV